MMHPAQHDPQQPNPHRPTYRYRAAIERRAPLEPAADLALLQHITVHSTDAVSAARSIAAVTGAAVVHTPERLDEALSDRVIHALRKKCPACGHIAYTAQCTECGAFKYPVRVPSFASEVADDDRRAA